MHVSTTQLIALRDREPVEARAREHVEQCTDCRDRLRQYETLRERLSSLPLESAPGESWQQICDRRDLESMATAPARDVVGRNVAFAASLLLVCGLATLVYFQPSMQRTGDEVMTVAQPTIHALQEQSRELEYALQQQTGSNVMSMHTAGTISELEDSIAFIDHELATAQETEYRRDLWQQRVELMQMLMMVRSAQQYASSI